MAPKRKPTETAAASSSGKTSLDVEVLRSVVELLEASDISHLSWRHGEERLVIHRGHAAPVAVAPVAMSASHATPLVSRPAASAFAAAPSALAGVAPTPPALERPGQLVTSPFVGTFYRTPSPDQPAFVETGSVVKKGQVLCIVEAMKLMNEIESESAGTIIEILAQNGQPVEFGQGLFRIEPL